MAEIRMGTRDDVGLKRGATQASERVARFPVGPAMQIRRVGATGEEEVASVEWRVIKMGRRWVGSSERPVTPSGMQTTQMTGGGRRSGEW